MADNDFEIFDGKSFKHLCRDIYNRSDQKHENLDLLVSELRPLIRNIEDAIQLVPLIQGYLEIAVRNDEQLVKLATVAQKLQLAKTEKGGTELLTEAEKDALWKEVQDAASEVSMPIPSIGSPAVTQ
jgi:hypothetical protein